MRLDGLNRLCGTLHLFNGQTNRMCLNMLWIGSRTAGLLRVAERSTAYLNAKQKRQWTKFIELHLATQVKSPAALLWVPPPVYRSGCSTAHLHRRTEPRSSRWMNLSPRAKSVTHWQQCGSVAQKSELDRALDAFTLLAGSLYCWEFSFFFYWFCLCHLMPLLFSRVLSFRDAGGDRAAPHSHRRDRLVARVADEDLRQPRPRRQFETFLRHVQPFKHWRLFIIIEYIACSI